MSEMPENIYLNESSDYGVLYDVELELDRDYPAGKQFKYIRADLVPQWMPIESAPKDGTYIDVYSENGRLTDVINLNGKFVKWGIDYFESAGWISVKELITHWMPIPKGPNDE